MPSYILDIESNGLLPEMTKVHCIVLKDIQTKEVFNCADQPGYIPLEKALEMISSASLLVGHNVIKFDLPAIKKIYPTFELSSDCKFFDTLVASRLFWPELDGVDHAKWSHIPVKYMGRHSLAAWGERLGVQKIQFKAEEKKKKGEEAVNVWENWSEEMQVYCAQDVEVSFKLYKYLSAQDSDPRSLELEHEFAIVMSKQERFGFPFDEKAAYGLVNTLKVKREEIDEKLQLVFPPIVQERVSEKTGKQLKSKVTRFNPASRQQTAERLREIYPEIVFDNTDKGNPQVDDDVLEKLGEKYPEAKLLAEYQMLNKRLGQIAEGKEAWLKHCQLYKDGRIHGEVKTNACISGRCSHCIEENQLVTTPSGYVKIKDIKTGDYVYSYDANLKLRLNKVSEVIDQGVQECYVVHWKTNSNGKSGSIICTENHKLLLRSGEYRRVKDIKKGDKICHLTVSITTGRNVLHMVNRCQKRQSTFIKEELYGKAGKDWHIHHIDGNKLNDNLDNLVVLTAEEHAKIHHTGKENSGYILKTKFQLLRMLAKAKAKPTRVPMDFTAFKVKCEEHGIDISKVAARYSKVTGKYITKRMVHTMLEQEWKPYKAGKEFKIDCHKERIDSLIDSHGIIVNHWIQGIDYLGPRQTYDLNVEHDHNFICQELCVSNSHPNMAQVPSVGHAYGAECRALFYAPAGWVLVGADASGLELRALGAMLAYFDGGEYAKLVSTEGFDIHTYNAKLFGIYDGQGEISKATRDLSKRLIYCVPVEGTTVLTKKGWKTYEQLEVGELVMTYNQEKNIKEWKPILHIVEAYEDDVWEMSHNHSYKVQSTAEHRWYVRKRTQSKDVQCGWKTGARYMVPKVETTAEINQESNIIVNAPLVEEDHEGIVVDWSWPKYGTDWTEKILQMSSKQRRTWLSGFMLADGFNRVKENQKSSWSISQLKNEHYEAALTAAYLEFDGHLHVSQSLQTNGKTKMQITIANKGHVTGQRLQKNYVGKKKVFCISTENESFVMRQGECITITGNCILYGGGAKKTGSVVSPSSSESKQYDIGRRTIDTFYHNLPAIKQLKDEIEKRINQRGYLVGIDGRRLQIRSKHSALNQLLQSTGAISVKKATTILYNDLNAKGLVWGKDYAFVAHVHDEVQALVKPEYAELYKELAIDSFRKSGEYFKLRCPLTGEARVGRNWMETH